MKYYLGLDNGGTTTKAAIYSQAGKEICVCHEATEVITPGPGLFERDMEEMWQTNCSVIRQVIDLSGISPSDISAVACCGHGKGLYLWGKDEKPAYHGILSADQRAWKYPEAWAKDQTADKVFNLSCQDIIACQPVSLLAWLKEHQPAVIPNIQYIFECKDYIRFRLTGEAYGEYTDYSGANFLNLHTKQYDSALLKLFGLEELGCCLPQLCTSTDLCGSITKATAAQTGLAEGTPVAGGMFDIDACALAVGITNSSQVCMIAGTWSINEYIRSTPVLDKTVSLNSLYCIPDYYLIEESSPTSAGNNQWFIDTLLPELSQAAQDNGSSIYETINQWVASLPAEEYCPIFLPFIMASNTHPNGKGSFVGITANHTRKHLLKSIYEGVMFSHRWHFERLLKSRTEPFSCIRLAGGAARSDVWAQMFADCCNLPVEIADIGETGTLGCAVAAAVAVKDYANYEDAIKHMIKIGKRYEPRAEYHEVYNKKYQLYLKIIDSLDSVWSDIQAYIEESTGRGNAKC
ncbi:FGGY-family carbohydrate kinase [Acetoanaerobium noterae]|jgi:L-xylulokinase|uniref:FGGY-family carbohydrate kinase n=1 Tax=Acetoanaerobium noterae TaxID=745369 RepID=UPI0028ABDF0D|nr:FGGY-family carbohydrate kinase [Acetoanaerobium noterae]